MSVELTQCPDTLPNGNYCDAPAEILDRFTLDSTDGPIEHVRMRCLGGHILTLPTYYIWTDKDFGQAA